MKKTVGGIAYFCGIGLLVSLAYQAIEGWRVAGARGDELYGQQQWQKALPYYQKVRDRQPAIEQAAMFYARGAVCCFQLGDNDQAMTFYRRLRQARTLSDVRLTELSGVFWQADQRQLALQLLAESLQVQPRRRLRLQYARLLAWDRCFEESVRQYQHFLGE